MGSPDFYVDEDRVLEIEEVIMKVIHDSREELLPPTRDISEEVPGKDGEIDFGTELRPRPFELHVAIELGDKTKPEIKRIIAKNFNPKSGVKTLEFADEPDRYYRLKYSGRIGTHRSYPSWVELTIPFKMPDPYIYSSVEHVSAVGSGCVVLNKGTVDTPMIVVIDGPSTSPVVAVSSDVYGNQEMQWNESVAEDKELVINTGDMTVIYDNDNGLPYFQGDFPSMVLPPGESLISAGGGGVTEVKWYDKWI